MKNGKVFSLFVFICIAHFCEHIAQMVQLYYYQMPMHQSGGILGKFYPWLAHSETLHYGYAIVMLIGLFAFRGRFVGVAAGWWLAALVIQSWHHVEHAVLMYQAWTGHNFFDAAQPISFIQFTGFFYGTPADNFGGLLKMSHFGICNCRGALPGTIHEFSLSLITVRRPEVHMMYNVLVMFPMFAAMYLNNRKELPMRTN